MKRGEIEKKIKEMIADRLDVNIDKVNLDSDLANDLGMDSFGAVELMFEMRDTFGVTLDEEEFKAIKKVKDIVERAIGIINNKNKKGVIK